MNLKETIVNDRQMAMKMRDKSMTLILGTLIGELDRIEKTPSDDTVIKTIKKIIENNTLHNINPEENQVLSQYLPKALTEVELTAIIHTQVTTNNYTIKDMGKIMKFLSEQYVGQYDGRLASNLIKTILS